MFQIICARFSSRLVKLKELMAHHGKQELPRSKSFCVRHRPSGERSNLRPSIFLLVKSLMNFGANFRVTSTEFPNFNQFGSTTHPVGWGGYQRGGCDYNYTFANNRLVPAPAT